MSRSRSIVGWLGRWAALAATLGAGGCQAELGEPYIHGAPPCGSSSPTALMGCVDRARFGPDLDFVAKERTVDKAQLQAVQDLCADRFQQIGLEVERHAYETGVNVIGVKPGVEIPDERIIVSAHYDHIAGCEGADDNASGIAGVLETARVLASGRFARTLVAACWDEEEAGLLGSHAYAERAIARGETIVSAYVYEMIGYLSHEPNSQTVPPGFDLVFKEQVAELDANERRGDFLLLVYDARARAAGMALAKSSIVSAVPTLSIELTQTQKSSDLFGNLRRSDHAAFWDVNLPAVMLTDTANFRNTHYHCKEGPDTRARLDDDYATKIIAATVGAAAEQLEVR